MALMSQVYNSLTKLGNIVFFDEKMRGEFFRFS